jgi:hypothetical protein
MALTTLVQTAWLQTVPIMLVLTALANRFNYSS